jgi:hypothetical protein
MKVSERKITDVGRLDIINNKYELLQNLNDIAGL